MSTQGKQANLLVFSKLTAILVWIFTRGEKFTLSVMQQSGPTTEVTQVSSAKLKEFSKGYSTLEPPTSDAALASILRKLRQLGALKVTLVEGEDHLRARCQVLEWCVTLHQLKLILGGMENVDHRSDAERNAPPPPPVAAAPETPEPGNTGVELAQTSGIDYSTINATVIASMLNLLRKFPEGFSYENLKGLSREELAEHGVTNFHQLYDRVRNQTRRQTVPRFVTHGPQAGSFSWKDDFKAYAQGGTVTRVEPTPTGTTPEVATEASTPLEVEFPLPEGIFDTQRTIEELDQQIEEAELVIKRGIQRRERLVAHLEALKARDKQAKLERLEKLCKAEGLDLTELTLLLPR